jgi:hypothetical protein
MSKKAFDDTIGNRTRVPPWAFIVGGELFQQFKIYWWFKLSKSFFEAYKCDPLMAMTAQCWMSDPGISGTRSKSSGYAPAE